MTRFISRCAWVAGVGLGVRAGAQTVDAPPEASPGAPGYAPYAPAAGPPEAPPTVPSPPPSPTLSPTPAPTPSTPPPEAPTVGEVGHWAISIERGFGFDYARVTQSMNGMTQQTNSATTLSLLSDPATDVTTAFSFPRFAVDAFVAPDLSAGAALGVFYGSETISVPGATSTDTHQSFTGVVFAPRVGYVARLSPEISCWLRAGISIIYDSTDQSSGGASTSSGSFHLIAATVEAPFVFTIAPRVAFTFGPTFDYAFSGGNKVNQTGGYAGSTVDDRVLEIGAQAGLVVTL
jgi:hypothetical protein